MYPSTSLVKEVVGFGALDARDSHTDLVQPTIISEDGNVSIVCAGCLIVC